MMHPALDSDPISLFHSSLLFCGFYPGLSLATSAQSDNGTLQTLNAIIPAGSVARRFLHLRITR
jgi:hypothetical protein